MCRIVKPKLWAERENLASLLGLLEAVFGLFLKFLVSSNFDRKQVHISSKKQAQFNEKQETFIEKAPNNPRFALSLLANISTGEESLVFTSSGNFELPNVPSYFSSPLAILLLHWKSGSSDGKTDKKRGHFLLSH